ncbi:hypothetical protein PRZ48_002943 [Zasmidium cellare]|uniref:Major facilitator superfamily (MFS) profile domain-containing protein n=1 Tax=Zasmidium cellare TaxID=395010 RepID=A0ABR0EU47_ZASCE|nr:hypothetical protein PRZ48_002943 [Zasmidium cellare]
MAEKNENDFHIESLEGPRPPTEQPRPEELAHLDDASLKRLERSAVRQLDSFLLPSVILLFLLNILDRNNIASAKVVNLPQDLGITNSEYNTCLMIFYVGYVITQIPSNLLITRVKPSIYLASVVAAWAVVSLSQGFVHNFVGLLLARFVLGLVEGPFLPGVFFLMSCYYKRSELPPRIAFLYGANMLASAFGGLIAAGITSQMHGVLGRPAWAWLFIIEGSITLAIAFAVVIFLPDYPLKTKRFWLSHEQQLVVEWRIRNENAGIGDEEEDSMLDGLKQALVDPKLYMFIVLQMSLLTAQSWNNFFPSIVGTLGFSSTVTLLLTAPPYLFAFAMFVPTIGARYFAMFLLAAGSYSPYNLCVSWASSTLPRPRAKRAAALAIVNLMGAGVAHFYTAYMFPDSQMPRYYVGGGIMSGACIVCAGAAIGIKAYLGRQNRVIERREIEGGLDFDNAGKDVTKSGVVSFRYVT